MKQRRPQDKSQRTKRQTNDAAATKLSDSLSREQAAEWAGWFQALGDPTRVLILHLLSSAEGPLSVGQITEALDVGQSTISHHLAKLAEVRFVLVDTVGTSTYWRPNDACFAAFPSAAEMIMGTVPTEFTTALERDA